MSRLIDNTIWNSRKFAGLSMEGKLLYLYLETSPETNYYGVFMLPPDEVLSLRTGIPLEGVSRALQALSLQGRILIVDDYVIIFDYLGKQKFNTSDKTLKGLENFKNSLPKNVLEAWEKGSSEGSNTPFIPPSYPLEQNKIKEKKKKSKINNPPIIPPGDTPPGDPPAQRKSDLDEQADSGDWPLLPYLQDEEFQTAYTDLVKHRKAIKAPITETTLKHLLKQLSDMAPNDKKRAIGIISKTIANGWRGLWDPDGQQGKSRGKKQTYENNNPGQFAGIGTDAGELLRAAQAKPPD